MFTIKGNIMKKVIKLIGKGFNWYMKKSYEFYKPMYDAGVNPFMI